jgi:hypothetical protein
MPTPSARVRAIKQDYQSNPETWGGVINDAVVERLDEARGQWVTKALVGNVSLDVQNYIVDEARAPMLRFTGAGPFTVTVPAVSYWYIVRNDCSADLTMVPLAGTGAVIRAGRTAIWTTNGTIAYVLDPRLNELRVPNANVDMGSQKAVSMAAVTAATDGATLSNTVAQFAAPAAALAMNNQKITGLGLATVATDAASLANKVHDFATPTANFAMGGFRITGLGAGTSATDAASLSNRLDQFAAPTSPVSMGSQVVTNVATPSAGTDAANRAFVQSEIAAAATINLPSVTGNAGRYLTNNGTVASWGIISTDEFAIHALG